jgi:hypothetical protein
LKSEIHLGNQQKSKATVIDTTGHHQNPGLSNRIYEGREKICETALHIYTNCRIFMQARSSQWGRAFALLLGNCGQEIREELGGWNSEVGTSQCDTRAGKQLLDPEPE